jgi:hypothetical protein
MTLEKTLDLTPESALDAAERSIYGIAFGSLEGLGDDDLIDEQAIYDFLKDTSDAIHADPLRWKIMRNPLEVARMIDYALRYWEHPMRDNIFDVVAREEERLLALGAIYYPVWGLSGDELGAGFLKKVGAGLKKAAKKVGEAVKKVVKKTVSAIKKVNPLAVTVRAGLLIAIQRNYKKMADRLQYGLYTDEQAQAAGLDMNAFREHQEGYRKAVERFEKIGGSKAKFNEAIRKGVKNKAINGADAVEGLGLDWSVVIQAAGKVIEAIIGFFKGRKDPKTEEPVPDEGEATGEELELIIEEGEKQSQQQQQANPAGAYRVTMPAGSAVDSVGNFLKNNAALIGIGVLGIAALSLLTRRL